MPKEKSLLVIGAWLIILAYFISIPTNIKNILFLCTGVLIIFISYGLSWERIRPRKNRSTIDSPEQPRPRSIKKERPAPAAESVVEDTEASPVSYDQPIKVKKSRTRTRQKFREEAPVISEEPAFETEKKEAPPSFGVDPEPLSFSEEDEDVIVISSDGERE